MSHYVRILILVLIVNYLHYYPFLISEKGQAGKQAQVEYVDHIISGPCSGITSQRDNLRSHQGFPLLQIRYSSYISMPCCPSEVLFIFFRSPIIFHDYHYG